MKKSTKLKEKLIIANPDDNVATARVDIDADSVLLREGGGEVTTQEKIPFGHKMALKPIAKGDPVLKYGQRIGVATSDIETGELVHVRNLAGERGRNK